MTGRQARYLRGLGHHLQPLVFVGKEGVSANLLKLVREVLAAHELVKVKVGPGCSLDRHNVATELASATGSEVAQILGRTILLYRDNPKREGEGKITLP